MVTQGKSGMAMYSQFEKERDQGNFELLPELHAILSGMKVHLLFLLHSLASPVTSLGSNLSMLITEANYSKACCGTDKKQRGLVRLLLEPSLPAHIHTCSYGSTDHVSAVESVSS